jgi:hypothetical protein
MKKVLLALIVVFMTQTTFAQVTMVPYCWVADQPGQDLQDGLFRIFIPTTGSALEVAQVLGLLMPALARQTGVATDMSLANVEIDMQSDLQYWQASGTYPTLESFKDAIVASLAPVLTQPGVAVQCAPVDHHNGSR